MAKILIMKDDTERVVKKETGRYWICEGVWYKKTNPSIQEVKEIKELKPKKKVEAKEKEA